MRLRVALALLATFACAAQAETTVQPIRFAAGRSSATIHGGIVRGDAAIYTVAARQGQTADIRVTSVETNADLMIYQPGSKVVQDDDGPDVQGTILPGGDVVPGLDAGATRDWHGVLPATGTYYILVSSDRGNVTYDLAVSIR